ncbi:beta-ketoacyl-[acyl-carrier-protein] synthase family protein [Tundrisphaera lichenicola]|uniref:beta-ketoacyl-[acyl-carrier-protein] synthase family protein n=1 Tax=Tundrisphaera lichenicola TaxID=2029860 RepID=UPI003EBD5A2C
MPRTERRVVITGLGLVTPLGIGADPLWASLNGGRGAVDTVRAFPVDGLPNNLGGEVPDFDDKAMKALAIPRLKKSIGKSLKYMARDIQLSVAGAQLAMVDAGLADGGVDPTRIGVDLGAGLISTELDELAPAIDAGYQSNGTFDYNAYAREGIAKITPIWLLKYLPNMLACHISILLDCQGPSNTITEAEAASNVAIGEATRIISRGRADVMITGGADSKIHPLSMVRMSLLDQMSRWRGNPSGACRPFDVARDGWVPGEGAGILILEEREHALARGAKIYGEILGSGSGCDASPVGGLDPEGVGTEIAIRSALRDAGMTPDQLGHLNAHGAASVVSDLAEARAIGRVFGEGSGQGGVPVTALKGYMGNIVSGCGAVELISSLLGVNRGLIPATLNCDDPDPALGPIDVVRGEARATDNPTFLNTNLTRHGQAAAVVVRGNPGIV